MQLRIALAGAIRALRMQRQLRHEDLSDASVKSKLSALERGETSITLEKFDSLAEALRIEPLALLAICMSTKLNTPYPVLLDAASKQLQAFEKQGGLEILAEQLAGGEVAYRKPGKPLNRNNEGVVRKLKAAGMNQSQIARETGLALSTVHRYWKRINAGDFGADKASSDD
ncbi:MULTISPECIES: helix-turn-helix domain-containing protein [unclassified Pseudomonas]|uniref:helix-turn-helix domain-containing protein n=1 Tax=unclassified Pseudomonas TaxID=196821 RepID=UPI000C88C302|nr:MULTISPECIES: helix-turn-helix domain-containing protein [unclassified Pseudomonas]PMX17789.1 Cro/Cl family transcriptional regulator [Pseudomonas sp. GW460-12]PMX30388.1 Cro/Cl family transcriptional regulator [Pseudomonas sp. MPR-R2A4]PMX36191.1 Cro/Cl family transcriptional regulator [Pseudomonas sp. MPR-R2A7]PMX48800.1 Cro/Cl family transcriptional regulator [Pseudomonas sp. MPR-R2A6]PMX84138.1 Cro/Cl family transcriptional regulator [Pseudomonas sp. MPR-R2A3]